MIPSYNEAGNILSTVKQVTSFIPGGNYCVDYLVVNDGSTDNTSELCRTHGIHCLNLIQNLGIGGAVQSGYRYARDHNYDIAVQFDGDGQHDIRCLDTLLEPILTGRAQFTVGSRFKDGGVSEFRSTFMRRIGIRCLSLLIRIVCGAVITDPTSGFRASNREIIALFAEDYPSDCSEPESIITLVKRGYTIKELPVNMFERTSGKSSITPMKSVYFMCKATIGILCAAICGKRGKHDTFTSCRNVGSGIDHSVRCSARHI